MNFVGKAGVVTGSGRGLGQATTVALASKGARLIINSRNMSQLEETRARVLAQTPKAEVFCFVGDLTKDRDRSALFEFQQEKFGQLDFLVNNAGAVRVKKFEALTSEDYRLCVETNLEATFFCSQLAFGRMKKKGGAILNISSLAGVSGLEKFEGFSAYSASKAAVIALSECLAVEGRDFGINVNCLCPGAIDTKMLREALPEFKTTTTAEMVAEEVVELLQKSLNDKVTGKVLVLENA